MRVGLLFLLALLQAAPSAVPLDPVDALLDAFGTHPVVAMSEGRSHGDKEGRAFLLSLIRDPRFLAAVNDVVVEFGSARYQDVADRFVRGDEVPADVVARIWQNSTQVNAHQRDCRACEELLGTVRDINTQRPGGRRLRLLLGDPPIDWDNVQSREDHRRWIEMRDSHAADLIRREVLGRQRRALVIYGGMHLQRRNLHANYESAGLAATLVSHLEDAGTTKVFTVWAATDPEKLQPSVASWKAPSLALLRGTVLGAADFTSYYTFERPRLTMRDGKPDFSAPVPREQWRTLRMEDQFDAVLYLGPSSSRETPSVLSPSMCTDTGYMKILRSRMALVGLRPEIERLKRYCAAVAAK